MKYEVGRKVSLDDLASLIAAARSRDGHPPLGEHKWLDLEAVKDGFLNVVAADGGAVVGYAHASRHASGWGLEIVVHPDYRNDTVERELVRRALDAVAQHGGGTVHFWVFKPGNVHDELAGELGLRKGRDLLHVCVGLPVDYSAPLPPGVRLRPFEPERDADAWLEVNNRAFAGHPEQGAWDRPMLERRMREAWFDPDDFLVATDDAGIAGFNWTKLHPERKEGEIYVIGVDPDRKASGLGKALLVAGLEHMAKRGMQTCCLYVDEANESARSMYTKFGFDEDHRDRAYVTDVPAKHDG